MADEKKDVKITDPTVIADIKDKMEKLSKELDVKVKGTK